MVIGHYSVCASNFPSSSRTRTRSTIAWDYFERVKDLTQAKYIHCPQKEQSNNTTNLIQPFKSLSLDCLSNNWIGKSCSIATTELLIIWKVFLVQHSLPYPNSSKRKDVIDKSLVLMIVKDLQPASFVSDSGILQLVSTIDSSYVTPSRKTIMYSFIPDSYSTQIQILKNSL